MLRVLEQGQRFSETTAVNSTDKKNQAMNAHLCRRSGSIFCSRTFATAPSSRSCSRSRIVVVVVVVVLVLVEEEEGDEKRKSTVPQHQ